MDDIRRPYEGQRRNYALPNSQPSQPPARPQTQPVTDLRQIPPQPQATTPPQPQTPLATPQQPAQQYAAPPAQPTQPVAQPVYSNDSTAFNVGSDYLPTATPYSAPRPAIQNKSSKFHLSLPIVAAIALVIVLAVAGFLLLKPKKASKPSISPTQLAQKASFSFFYPNPLPTGYTYIPTLNAFQDGQAYYMLGNGKKHMVVHEQAATSTKLDISSLTNPTPLQTESGKAAIGTIAGGPAAVALDGSTFITVNTTGSVPPSDLETMLNSLKVVSR
jgi:hypothetical protein